MSTEEKTLIIPGSIGYKLKISNSGYEIAYDQSNENNLAAMSIVDALLGEIIDKVSKTNFHTDKAKKAKRDRLDRLRKLKMENVNNMADVSGFLLEKKVQGDYITDKPKIKIAKLGEENNLKLK